MIQRSDLTALWNEIDRLWTENRHLREKLATTWEQAMVRFGEPLYDSGWVLSAVGGTHTFTHNLGKLPTQISLMAADDSSGTNPVIMVQGRDSIPGYGCREHDLTATKVEVYLDISGYAYSGAAAKWYIRGTDYIRLLMWAIDT